MPEEIQAVGSDDHVSGPLGLRAKHHLFEEIRSLRTERDHFKHQVNEMSKFLQDYGLTWVGDSSKNEGSLESSRPQSGASGSQEDEACANPVPESRPMTATTFSVDVQVMSSKVEGLNASVKQEGARIVASRVGGAVHARLVADEDPPVPLTFFKDGVKLGRCSFEQYDTSGAQHLIRDILDGFFPYALKDDYPDGVLLKVIDRTTCDFAAWLEGNASTDRDLTDGGSRLVVQGGRALNGPAGGVSGLRGGNAGSRGTSLPGSVSKAAAPNEISLVDEGRDPTAPMARLQVKLEGGLRVVLCMEPHHTLGQLEDGLERWCTEQGVSGLKGLHLRTAFPPQTFSDRDQTLLAAGLTPSATLFVAAEAVA